VAIRLLRRTEKLLWREDGPGYFPNPSSQPKVKDRTVSLAFKGA